MARRGPRPLVPARRLGEAVPRSRDASADEPTTLNSLMMLAENGQPRKRHGPVGDGRSSRHRPRSPGRNGPLTRPARMAHEGRRGRCGRHRSRSRRSPLMPRQRWTFRRPAIPPAPGSTFPEGPRWGHRRPKNADPDEPRGPDRGPMWPQKNLSDRHRKNRIGGSGENVSDRSGQNTRRVTCHSTGGSGSFRRVPRKDYPMMARIGSTSSTPTSF